MNVEIWSDVVCPWCYIGKKRFETALANLAAEGIELDINITFRPFQLDPSAPRNAPSPVIDGYAKKFGGVEKAHQIINHVTSAARDSGIEFHMENAVRANTLQSHRLLHLALLHHGASTQVALKQALLEAYFTDGKDIGSSEVLIACAQRAGISPETAQEYLSSDEALEEVLGDFSLAGELGITAVPTFVFDGKWTVPGAQDVAVFENVLRRLATRTLTS
jgi:predicted DsbA family dithiol-disulfide isomerase